MNKHIDNIKYQKQLTLLEIESNLLLLYLEELLDQMDSDVKKMRIPMYFLLFVVLIVSTLGWLALYFPKHFLNLSTLLAAKLGITFTIITILLQLLLSWKWNREWNRESQERLKKRSREQRDAEKKELIKRRDRLREPVN